MKENYDYDAVIIGAGISGLVCGCYLAKAGLRTLIVEKNAQAGGYCTSFKRNGYLFDACAHGISSLRKTGRLTKILNDFKLSDKIRFIKHNPSDMVITPEYRISLGSEIERNIDNFQKCFPEQNKQIECFFKFIELSQTKDLLVLRSKTFEQIVRSYFSDHRLITIVLVVTFLLSGVDSFKISGIVGCLLWREFIFDGGYYPSGGMQTFSNVLVDCFKDLNGSIVLSKQVKKILVNDRQKVEGICIEGNKTVVSKYVISACDLVQTYSNLIDKEVIPISVFHEIDSFLSSFSGFMVYLGLKDKCSLNQSELTANLYVINGMNLEEIYSNFLNSRNSHFVISSPTSKSDYETHKTSICLTTNALYNSDSFWSQHKRDELMKLLIKQAEMVIPNLSNCISTKISASPVTLRNWTANSCGAAYGWASTVEQFMNPSISQNTQIENLYLTGHWTNLSSGIPFVASCGYDTADLILHKESKKI